MDQSLDEVRRTRKSILRGAKSKRVPAQVIAARPKSHRRTGRRGSAKTQVLGHPANAAARTAAQNSAAAKVVAAAAPPSHPADKIIVSNLPADVNEVQIKVNSCGSLVSMAMLLTAKKRNSSIRLSVLFVMSPCTTTVLAVRKELLPFTSRGKEMGLRLINNTTTD